MDLEDTLESSGNNTSDIQNQHRPHTPVRNDPNNTPYQGNVWLYMQPFPEWLPPSHLNVTPNPLRRGHESPDILPSYLTLVPQIPATPILS